MVNLLKKLRDADGLPSRTALFSRLIPYICVESGAVMVSHSMVSAGVKWRNVVL